MIAPAELGQDVRPFLRVARHLDSVGLGAPRVLAEDVEAGLLLLEDFGDDLFASLAKETPELEQELYVAAVNVLIDLHRHAPPRFAPVLDASDLAEMTEPAWSWYANQDGREFVAELRSRLTEIAGLSEVLALRDYHAENLIWRPAESGLRRVGLLDFQDAFAGHRAYDLVSLLEDARRDVPPLLREEMIAHYIDVTKVDEVSFRRALALLGAQRNLRIIGIFTRLCLRDGKPGYLRLIPRVWGHLMNDLSHPDLDKLKALALALLPEPNEDTLTELESRCTQTV